MSMKKIAKPFLSILVFLLLGSLFFGIFSFTLLQPVNSHSEKITRFVIPRGQAISVIGNRLQAEGLIKNVWALRFVVAKKQLGDQIQAGSFELSPRMNVWEVAQELTRGTSDVWVTIPEGWRREEIAASLSQQGLDLFSGKEFLILTEDLEGKLFPDTYLVPRQVTTQQIVQLLQSTFETKIVKALDAQIKISPRPFDQVLTMASLVEREAKGSEQMKHVAGILWNRIDIGMSLQVDATLQYAKGYSQAQNSWWALPLAADKERTSPFNTYLNLGLPPHSIANPGLEAIKAALDPLDVDDLYYLHDAEGKMYYAQTLDGHKRNINAYLRN